MGIGAESGGDHPLLWPNALPYHLDPKIPLTLYPTVPVLPPPIPPGPGQESVWDYPRPPRLELSPKPVRVEFNGVVLAQSDRAYRVLETSHPPSYYLPPEDVQMRYLLPTLRASFCEWKGQARYYTVMVDDREAIDGAWVYLEPTASFAAIAGYVAFYPSLMDACYVGDDRAEPQPGGFYGGWVTPDVVGPFKGVPGSWGW